MRSVSTQIIVIDYPAAPPIALYLQAHLLEQMRQAKQSKTTLPVAHVSPDAGD